MNTVYIHVISGCFLLFHSIILFSLTRKQWVQPVRLQTQTEKKKRVKKEKSISLSLLLAFMQSFKSVRCALAIILYIYLLQMFKCLFRFV